MSDQEEITAWTPSALSPYVGPSIGALCSLVPFLVPLQFIWAVKESKEARERIQYVDDQLGALRGTDEALDARLRALEEAAAAGGEKPDTIPSRDLRVALDALALAGVEDEQELVDACVHFAAHAIAGRAGSQLSLTALSVLPRLTGHSLRLLHGMSRHSQTRDEIETADPERRKDTIEALAALGLVTHQRPNAPQRRDATLAWITRVGREVVRLTTHPDPT